MKCLHEHITKKPHGRVIKDDTFSFWDVVRTVPGCFVLYIELPPLSQLPAWGQTDKCVPLSLYFQKLLMKSTVFIIPLPPTANLILTPPVQFRSVWFFYPNK